MLLGMWMGMHEDFTYKDVHAHLNLVGWVTMFLYGLFYRGDERAAQGVLPEIQFWCAVVGLIIFAPGIWAAQTQAPLSWLTIPGSLLTFASMVIFLIVVIRAAGRSRRTV
jgi:cbb3-type cytochrome oxidase subunit 1